jgi:Zn-dependent peptidase ImmA (M78 family)
MKLRRNNKYISAMCSATGETQPLRAIAAYTGKFRKRGASLDDLCRVFGITAVLKEKLSFDGGIFDEEDRLIIKINSCSIATRQRFTLAHELGHLIVSSGDVRSARRCLTSNPLEDACDAVAAELLMPLDSIMSTDKIEQSAESLERFASRFRVSLHAATKRLRELKIWNASVGLWGRSNFPKPIWYEGIRYWTDATFPLTPFDKAFQYNERVHTGISYWDVRGVRTVRLRIEGIGNDRVVAFVFD